MLRRLFRPRPAALAGQSVYAAAAAQARNPGLYRELGAPDRIDVRFELYTLHLGLLLRRLAGQGEEAAEAAQAALDAYVASLDDVLRDLGVGDLSMSKKMKKLAGTLMGRLQALGEALEAEGDDPLADFLARNIYEGDRARAAPLADYVRRAAAGLASQPLTHILKGRPQWPAVTP
jgi:cytochrome b pre-mRNA-processing protein 3